MFHFFQVGKKYQFMNCRASKVKCAFAHLSKNENGMELFGTAEFDVKEVPMGELTTAERNSIVAKSDSAGLVAYLCPKITCGNYMEKISEDDYNCGRCDMSYSTFKFHEGEIADETSSPLKRKVEIVEIDVAAVADKASSSSKGKNKIGVVAADGGGQQNELQTPKKRARYGRKAKE